MASEPVEQFPTEYCHLFMTYHTYMHKIAPKFCLAGFVLSCSRIGIQATGTLMETSDVTDNYCTEALDAATCLSVI
jgi:hypothetical protein